MKKYRNRAARAVVLAALLGSCLLSACKRQQEESGTYLYYLNQERTKIVREAYEPKAADTSGQVQEYIRELSEETGSVDHQRALPKDVRVERYELEDHQLRIYLNEEYHNIPTGEEVLCRGVIVHTMMQVPGLSGVSLFVADEPLADANGKEIGIMTNDSFVENPGEKINTIQEADIKLYFASKDGNGLVSETRHVYYSSNISQEKLVMERLLNGPGSESSNVKSAIPEGTELIGVSVMNGVCFVNLGEGFLAQDFKIREDVVIYSIVDSLTELPSVDTVQISVNGETDMIYREKMSLKEYYRQNLDLVVEEGDRIEEEQPAEESGERGKILIENRK